MTTIDVLMVTYDRPHYVRRSLKRLLDTSDRSMSIWLWHNGCDDETLSVTSAFARHPRVAAFHHSPDNVRLRQPTNWMWERSTASYVSKVDDDCLVTPGWADTLRRAHEDNAKFGVIGSWRFPEEDFVPEVAQKKIQSFRGGHSLMLNCWVQGSAYLMKRECVDVQGVLGEGQSFTWYCIELARRGYVNGWYFPFIAEDHMDDPRSPNTGIQSDDDLMRRLPLSTSLTGARTVEAWQEQLREEAHVLQRLSSDPRNYYGWRWLLRRSAQELGQRMGRARDRVAS